MTSPRAARLIAAIAAGFAFAAGCATVKPPVGTSLVPTQHQARIGPYCVFTPAPLAPDAPALRSLGSLEAELGSTLGLRMPPESDPIEVYILDGPESFRHFLTYYFPELPTRRAFFLAKGGRRVVYTYQGGRLDEDLRHEATHALLHAAAPDLPLWLDEGLAEYFEVEEGRAGLNAEHLARLPEDFASGFTPDFRRLEGLKDVRKMTPRDYRESWAWVHYLLSGPPSNKAALLAYLADQRSGGEGKALSRRLPETVADGLAEHVESARRSELALRREKAEADETVRFQDRPADRAMPKRRGFLGRVAGLFGF